MQVFRRTARFFFRHKGKFLLLLVLLFLGYLFCLPKELFEAKYSTVLFDREGELLGAKIAADGQWRFPPSDSIPDKYKEALFVFEDKRFESHWGLDIWALGRALYDNIRLQRKQSGASTITMQVIRMSRKNPPRTLLEKAWEAVLATRLEWRHTKEEILLLYASHAPFGGNVVGLEAAAWKYFNRPARKLSWAEAALLAVLPNSPSSLHLARNRVRLEAKRNRLLDRLYAQGSLDSLDYALAKIEPLPERPQPLPMPAPHLLERLHRSHNSQGQLRTTISRQLQERLNEIVQIKSRALAENGIHNAAVLLIENQTGDVLAYIGNVSGIAENHARDVDMIPAPRSSGSILKPFLYAAALDAGEISPLGLLPDIPAQFTGYAPKNYDGKYRGLVPADQVVSQSLNVPAVHLLQQYGLLRFYQKLQALGMRSLHSAAEHYGLSLILGGAESTLWDLGGMYSGMARTLLHYQAYNSRYDRNDFREPNLLSEQSQALLPLEERAALEEQGLLSASAIWHCFNAMQELVRPGEEEAWRRYASSHRIAWKTGTSFGFRDAWALGVSRDYTVAVWVGNADGEGRPGLVGVRAAAPLLFQIFQSLNPRAAWFSQPFDDMELQAICRESGQRAQVHCSKIDTLRLGSAVQKSPVCAYHKAIALAPDAQLRVHSDCESPQRMRQPSFFVLPPAQEWYYRRHHPEYEPLPPFRSDCASSKQAERQIELIYPSTQNLRVYIPKQLDGERSRVVLEAAHRKAKTTIYWHLDEDYLGQTQEIHQLAIYAKPGVYTLSLLDEDGELLTKRVEFLGRGD